MAIVKIITLKNPTQVLSPYVERISHHHSKYGKRKQYVDNILLPNLIKQKYFKSVDRFSAITPEDFVQNNEFLTYKEFTVKYNGPFPANLLSNYVLWKECIKSGETMLILEDDSFFPEHNSKVIIDAIENYENLKDVTGILYLLSQCPQNTRMKTYSKSNLIAFNEKFLEWDPNRSYTSHDDLYEDISGTAAYVINPKTAKALCDLAEKTGTEATDRFVGRACLEKVMKIIIPKEYDKLFLLHEQLEEWNIVHKNKYPLKWEELPDNWKSAYLMDGLVKLEHRYVNEMDNPKEHFDIKKIDEFIVGAKNREYNKYGTYGMTDQWLYEAFDLVSIDGLSVAVMGSTRPWYESVVLAFGGNPTTIEYNLPNYKHPKLKEKLLREALLLEEKYDVGVSISSFEHDGLGRYGDPLNPDGDLRSMLEMKKLLKPGGVLFLSVPCGVDKIAWNAHRIYGNQRIRLLLNLWEVMGTVGYEPENLSIDTGDSGVYQPIFVLKNI